MNLQLAHLLDINIAMIILYCLLIDNKSWTDPSELVGFV